MKNLDPVLLQATPQLLLYVDGSVLVQRTTVHTLEFGKCVLPSHYAGNLVPHLSTCWHLCTCWHLSTCTLVYVQIYVDHVLSELNVGK